MVRVKRKSLQLLKTTPLMPPNVTYANDIVNVGSEDQIEVRRIAEIVVEELGLDNVQFMFTGGTDGEGDGQETVKNMLLDISRLSARKMLVRLSKR